MVDVASEQWRRRCLKPNPDRWGTWTARRFGRPVALRLTRVAEALGITADQATAAAATAMLAAVAAFAYGTPSAWLVGSLLLVVWYLLDHVDGQLARLNGTASLDGTTVDYLMHHSWNLLVPSAVGFGLARRFDEPLWCAAGLAWSWGALMITLRHDARYKAFFQRLKLLRGEVRTVGGGGGRPEAASWPRRGVGLWSKWFALKAYEQHVVTAALLILSVVRVSIGPIGDAVTAAYVALLALPAPLIALRLILVAHGRGEAEREFAAWFRVPEGATLELRDGWWIVEGCTATDATGNIVAGEIASCPDCRHPNEGDAIDVVLTRLVDRP